MNPEKFFVENFSERSFGSRDAALKARNKRARELRKNGYKVKCSSANGPFDGWKVFSLEAVLLGYEGPVVHFFGSRPDDPKNVYVVLPDGSRR